MWSRQGNRDRSGLAEYVNARRSRRTVRVSCGHWTTMDRQYGGWGGANGIPCGGIGWHWPILVHDGQCYETTSGAMDDSVDCQLPLRGFRGKSQSIAINHRARTDKEKGNMEKAGLIGSGRSPVEGSYWGGK